MMVWEEFDRPGATRAFRVASPDALRGEHWFELERVDEGVRLRHTIAGDAVGEYETIWRGSSQHTTRYSTHSSTRSSY
jgi:hypothetical protein